jgi:hypothetical protein
MRLCVLVTLTVAATTGAMADEYKMPRLVDGSPDLQGVWTNATQTPLERSAELGTRRTLTREEAEAIEKKARGAVAADALPSDPNEKIEAGALPPVGNYNLFWTDRGMTAAEIDGEYRSSVIVDPPNGRIPVLANSSDQRRAAARMRGESAADGPEQRPLGERCLLSFGSSAGPPMLPTMYNSYYQIVQSKDSVMIMVEMVHDVRMIRIGGQHPPSHIRKWMGDSIGRWDGDTLVVETSNFRPDQNFRGSSEDMLVTERFKRVADDKIVYSFTIRDPKAFASEFTGELPFLKADVNIYEYACHEGNYSLPGILAAEREKEKAEAAAKQSGK